MKREKVKGYPNQDSQKNTNEGTQTKKKDLIKFKSAKCYNEHYIYKTKHDRLHHLQQGKEKLQELKERNYKVIIRKRKHICWYNRGEDTCVNLYRVINEDTSGNPIYLDKNGIIYTISRRVCQQMKNGRGVFGNTQENIPWRPAI